MSRVLVVDDSPIDRRVAGGILEKDDDIEVTYASNGVEALEILARNSLDLVLTDLTMPEMDGLELVANVKAKFPHTPVILMTAKGSEETAVRALQLGAAGYVPKRHLATELVNEVNEMIVKSSEERTLSDVLNCVVQTECTYVLQNDPALACTLAHYLQQSLAQLWGCDKTDQLRFGIALEEALVNAYLHGNLEVGSEIAAVDHQAYFQLAEERAKQQPYRDRRIHVRARFSLSEAVYVIRDEGPGFDTSTLPDPTDPENLDKPTGRGILLMRTFMDQVTYNRRGNEVTLVKKRSAEGLEEIVNLVT